MTSQEMKQHDMDYGTGYCYKGCKACHQDFKTELKIIAAVAIIAILFFALVCPCHGAIIKGIHI
jgi:hypothetical protein